MKSTLITLLLLISTLSFSQLDPEYMERPFNGIEEDTLYYQYLDSNGRIMDSSYLKLYNFYNYYFYDFSNTKSIGGDVSGGVINSPIKKEE